MVVYLAGGLSRAGIRTGVVSFFEPRQSQFQQALLLDAVPVWSLAKRVGPDFPMIRKFRALIGRLRPAVIHTHLSALRYAVPAVLGMRDRPHIVHTVHRVADRDSELWLRWLQRWCLHQCMEVVAVSEEVAQSCARVYGEMKVSVIPNGIPARNDTCAWNSRPAKRASLGIGNDSFVFCCVAGMRAVKNHKTLLRAFAAISRHTDTRLLLVGDGELRAELEALTRALQITPQTHFIGEREDVAEVLAASDAFVLASLSEGTPFSVLEAMAAGLPVIATSVGGLPEIIRNGTDGFLVPAGNVDALEAAMARIISDDESRLAMARAASHRVTQRFDALNMVKSYLSIYERGGVRAAMGAA